METITFIELAKLLISFAILAPSGHNSQPWQFQVSDNEIIITPDYSKRLDVVDGNDRELFISLGCAVENLMTAARHYGYDSNYDFNGGKIVVTFSKQDVCNDDPLFDAIKMRHTHRGNFTGEKIPENLLQNICDETLNELERKRWVVYKGKETVKFTPLNVAKQAILLLDESEQDNVSSKIEGIFSKLPMFDKVMEMVDDVETSVPYVIFVLVHPKDYKAAVKDAGNISVTVADRLRLVHKPLIAVRNDLFIKPGYFGLNIVLTDEVEDNPPYNIEIQTNTYDEVFIKKNSRNIASTIAGRLGSWKFPFVSVKPNMILEKPGEFEIYLEKNSKKKKEKDKK